MFTDIENYILLFFLYGFMGWCAEVAFAACKHSRFVNRGFLNGPICPIYGFGVVLVVLALRPVFSNLALLYLGSFFLTTAIEFLTGFLLERIFHARWWDYSTMPLNICGYVCLLFSIIWGLACMVIVRWVHPAFYRMVVTVPRLLAHILTGSLIALIITDCCATLAGIRKLSERLRLLTEIAGEIHKISDSIGQSIADHTMDTKEHVDEARARVDRDREQAEARIAELRVRARAIMEERHFGTRRILEAFPNLKSHNYAEGIAHMREHLKRSVGK